MAKRTSNVLGHRMKKLREENQISQVNMAKELGVAQNAIFRYETGKSFPGCETLVFYADKFGVTLDWLFGRTEVRGVPGAVRRRGVSSEELQNLVDYALTPGTEANDKLRTALESIIGARNAK
ncbi:MAG: helix-turn-helix transcriptional regulator [Bacilli bacterium]|nr:helix-turn-helix transcriptional regulator [Bacilli bacterium]